MKKLLIVMAMLLCMVGSAHADLDDFLSGLNVQARADMRGFSLRLSSQFDVPVTQVEAIIKTVDDPADVFVCLQLGQMTNTQPEVVVRTYRRHKNRGWGEIAKELGIKPGSEEFHALKRGEYEFTGKHKKHGDKGHGKGKGKGKGKGNDD